MVMDIRAILIFEIEICSSLDFITEGQLFIILCNKILFVCFVECELLSFVYNYVTFFVLCNLIFFINIFFCLYVIIFFCFCKSFYIIVQSFEIGIITC